MNYYFENGKITKFSKEVKIVYKNNYEGDSFCIDEKGYQLLNALNENYKITGNVLKVGSSTIPLLNDKPVETYEDLNFHAYINYQALKKATLFVSRENAKYKGVAISENGSVYSTDTFKAFLYKIAEGNTVVLSVELFNALLNELDDDFTIHWNDHCAYVETENKTIVGRLYQDKYPVESLTKLATQIGFTSFWSDTLKDYLSLGKYIDGSKVVDLKDGSFTLTSNENATKVVKPFDENGIPFITTYDNLVVCLNAIESVNNYYEIISFCENKPILVKNGDYKAIALPIRRN